MKRVLLALFALACFFGLEAQGPNTMRTFPSITGTGSIVSLGAASSQYVNATVVAQGYATPGDGGGGLFYWNASSTTTADGGTVFAATGVSTGRWFRQTLAYITPEMYGAKGDNSTDDSTAINAATAAACTNGYVLVLDKKYVMKSTWNMTFAAGCNNGITVIGDGINISGITFKAATNNTGNGWDATGLAYGTFRDFHFDGGTSGGSNSPQVTFIAGGGCTTATAPCTGTFVFGGIMSFDSVRVTNFQGTRAFADPGSEQITLKDCIFQGITSSVSALFQFDAGGSLPLYTSAIVQTQSPVKSMTQVHWFGSRAILSFTGSFGVLFHFTAAGGVADIHFDNYVQNLSTSGASIFMGDDSNDTATTAITNVGGSNIQYESAGGNAAMTMAAFTAATVSDINFDGFTGSGTTLTTTAFDFRAGITVENTRINWGPNIGGVYSPGELIQGHSGTLFNGITVQAPLAKASLLSGGTETSYILQGTDGTLSDNVTGASQTCTISTGGTMVFANGLLQSGTCNH